MKTKIKTTLLTVFFFWGFLTSLHAQDKFEFAVIFYQPVPRIMEISINGTEYKKIDVDNKEVLGLNDVNAALKEIKNMSKEGWEVFNTDIVQGQTVGSRSFVFYLRRKAK